MDCGCLNKLDYCNKSKGINKIKANEKAFNYTKYIDTIFIQKKK